MLQVPKVKSRATSFVQARKIAVEWISTIAVGLICVAGPLMAQDVFITPELPFMELDTGSEFIFIERNQDPDARIADAYTLTSRQCPPFCVQPFSAGEGVETVGELEVLAFMEEHVTNGTGFIIDARLSEWYERGTIPGSINLAFTTFENPETNPFLVPILELLTGEVDDDGSWTFVDAPKLMIFCNGLWCGQSHRAISNLTSIGYPAEQISYYRGGMQAWLSVGLTVQIPGGD